MSEPALVDTGQVQVRGRDDLDLLRELPMGVKAVHGLAFAPSGNLLVAGGADGKLRVWELD